MTTNGDEGLGLPSPTRILALEHILGLPADGKLMLGRLVSEALLAHTVTMLQYAPPKIVDIMDEGRAVVAVGATEEDLHGFAQLSPWRDAQQAVQAVEFRTWLACRPGAGLHVLRGAVALNRIKYPDIPLYAVIEDSNGHAQELVVQAGAQEVPMPSSMAVELKAEDEPALVRTFDLTDIDPHA